MDVDWVREDADKICEGDGVEIGTTSMRTDGDGTWICSMPFSGVYSPRPAVHGSPVPRWLLHYPRRMLPVVDGFVPPAAISSSSHVIGRHAGPMTWNSLSGYPRDPTLSYNVFNRNVKTYRTRIERMRV